MARQSEPEQHTPPVRRAHIAQEYRETEKALGEDELIFILKDWAKIRALGGRL